MLLTLTNDAWFGKSAAQAQHLQMGKMRALEFARPLLFVSNDGITAIIGPDGRTQAAAPAHEIFVLNGTVQPTHGLTPWMKNGSNLIIMILLYLLFLAIRENIARARTLRQAITPTPHNANLHPKLEHPTPLE